MSFIGNVPAEAYSTVAKDTFSGNGSTTDFTLSLSATTNGVEVFVENVQQEPTTAYTISGTTLSFTAAPTSGTNNIYVIHRGPAVQTVAPPAGVAIDASTVTVSGDVSIADKIVHTGDTNTAIRFPAADTVTVETGGSERVRVDSSGNITVESSGTATPTYDYSTLGEGLHFRYWDQSGARHADIVATGNTPAGATQDLRFFTNSGGSPGTASERMRLDSSGNFLVGKTTTAVATVGAVLTGVGQLRATVDGDVSAYFNRQTSDGTIVEFRKDNTQVGSIGVNSSNAYFAGTASGIRCYSGGTLPTDGNGANSDNAKDLGEAGVRWDDVYATNGTIQTSDRNEKQDIEELSEAEQRVAVAAKGLLRKFRWIDAVAEKGDDARIHFGIIAQDLQAAFEAEGLDAGRYAMFISSTWWETQTDVPSVEAQDAVVDEDGNVIQEAVEAKDAYVRTDTYDTADEAPEGATERTRLGVRYPELLAFIIGAL